jgi:hypothetical protein
MDTLPFAGPGYSTATVVLIGILVTTFIIGGVASFLYWVNTRIRRSMKASGDDWRVEKDIEAGHTLHAEGIYGVRHPEGGRHLDQEDPHAALDALRPGLTKRHSGKEEVSDGELPDTVTKTREIY